MKVVINACFGGFGLSDSAVRRYCELKGIDVYQDSGNFGITEYWTVPKSDRVKALPEPWFNNSEQSRKEYNRLYSGQCFFATDIARDDKTLVQVVEELGEIASGKFAKLTVVEIPDDVSWEISEYDGNEHVNEVHRSWR